MKKIISPLAGVVCACLVSYSLHAEEQPLVLVTATRTPELADQTLAPVIVITQEEIQRSQAGDIAELLRFHAGLDIGRNGGPGQATSLFIRGTDSNHALVMIDGVRINPGTIGGANIQNIDPAIIDHIEIVEGPRSTLYGSDAIGGVVNIITRQVEKGTVLSASAAGGTYDTRRYSASLQQAGGEGVRLGIDSALQTTSGFPPREESTIDRGFDNSSIAAHLGRRFGPVDVEISHFEARGNTGYLDFFLAPVDQNFVNSVSALRLAANPLPPWASRLTLSESRDRIDQNQSDDYAHTDRKTVDWQNDVQLGRAQLLTIGGVLTREQDASLVFGTGFDETIDVKEAYVQDVIARGAHRGVVSARYTDHESFGGHTTWNAEYGFQAADVTRFTLAAGTAFRAPDATDRFGFGGDPNLNPEKARNVEAGVRQQLAPGSRVSLQVFRTDITDLIEYDTSVNRMVNIGKARIRGVQAKYEYARDRLHASIEAIAQNPTSETTDQPLPRRARRSATAAIVWDGAQYQLGADLLAAGRRKDSDFSGVYMGGYGLLNLTVAYRLDPEWMLRARVENVFDKRYELANTYNTVRRSFLLELAWRHRIPGEPG
jgi:vitamin B12 transporter